MTWWAARAEPPLRFPRPDSGLTRCATFALVLVSAAALAAAQETRFMVGVGEVKITPPMGTPMAGFSARQGPSRGVHDDLFVRTLVVSLGETSVALVACEVIGVDRPLVEEIRRRAAGQTGLPAESILIAATHTHSGPVLQGEYQDFFVRSAVESVAQAWRARRPRKLGSGVAPHGGWVGMNRRRLESGFSPVDKEIQVLKVTDSRGRVEAVLFNYPCHPACLGPDNLLISADWPHFAMQRLRERLGETVKVLYFQGTQGNINTGYSAGLSALGVPIPTRTFTYARELGEIIAEAILSKLLAIPSQSSGALSSRRDTVALEYYIPSTLDEARRNLGQAGRQVEELSRLAAPQARLDAARVERAFADYSLKRLERNLKEGQREYRAEIQTVRVGEAAFVSFPGEFFVEVGLEVKKRSPFAATFCLGLANDNLGYFPTSEAYAEGGYEVSVARFGPRSTTYWQDAAARLLKTLASESGQARN